MEDPQKIIMEMVKRWDDDKIEPKDIINCWINRDLVTPRQTIEVEILNQNMFYHGNPQTIIIEGDVLLKTTNEPL